MVPTIIINGLTVVHKSSDGMITSAAPDMCITPGAGPVAYVNVAFSKDIVNGSVTVMTDGVTAALKDTEFTPSHGDEPGTGGGVVSGVNMGWAKFTNYSQDVKFEGRNVARLSDPMMMNGNNPNTNSPAEMQTNLIAPNSTFCKIFCNCDAGKKPDDFIQVEEIDPRSMASAAGAAEPGEAAA